MFTSVGLIDFKGHEIDPGEWGSILIIVLKNNKRMPGKLDSENWSRFSCLDLCKRIIYGHLNTIHSQ